VLKGTSGRADGGEVLARAAASILSWRRQEREAIGWRRYPRCVSARVWTDRIEGGVRNAFVYNLAVANAVICLFLQGQNQKSNNIKKVPSPTPNQ
jgi:hypothetical protein